VLIISLRTEDTADDVIIRDASGRKICEVKLIECSRVRARLGFEADKASVRINRRSIDRLAYPGDYPEVK
jgi:hypothetical protein